MTIAIERRQDPAAVDRLLRMLPAWFGIDEAVRQYVEDAGRYPSYLASDGTAIVGVALVHRHYPESAEIHLIAVDPARHRTGIGAAPIDAIKTDLAADGVRLLQVHTVGPSSADTGYELTRAFYRQQHFLPLQEFDRLEWDGPTQILVALLDAVRPPAD